MYIRENKLSVYQVEKSLWQEVCVCVCKYTSGHATSYSRTVISLSHLALLVLYDFVGLTHR